MGEFIRITLTLVVFLGAFALMIYVASIPTKEEIHCENLCRSRHFLLNAYDECSCRKNGEWILIGTVPKPTKEPAYEDRF